MYSNITVRITINSQRMKEHEMDKEPTIWKSRKFWILICDAAISISTYFVTKYLNPAAGTDVLFLIGVIQPIVYAVIKGYENQNIAGIKAQAETNSARIYGSAEVNVAELHDTPL